MVRTLISVTTCVGNSANRLLGSIVPQPLNGIPYNGWGTIEPNNRFAEFPTHVVTEIKVRTICPDHMTFGDVGFIKIDVEGHELDVLAGLHGILVKDRKSV